MQYRFGLIAVGLTLTAALSARGEIVKGVMAVRGAEMN